MYGMSSAVLHIKYAQLWPYLTLLNELKENVQLIESSPNIEDLKEPVCYKENLSIYFLNHSEWAQETSLQGWQKYSSNSASTRPKKYSTTINSATSNYYSN